MGYIELSPRDQIRYKLPDRIEFAYGEFGLRSVAALKKETGYSIEYIESAIAGTIAIDPETGEETVKHDPEIMAAMVWLIVRSAGHRIPWEEWDPLAIGLKINLAGDDDTGKDQPPSDQESTSTTTD